jgi:hypothetical protein
MPRKKSTTVRARQKLRGPRRDVSAKRPRWYAPRREREQPRYRLADGTLLNVPESIVAFALEDLKIPFQAQKPIGPGRKLGGALIDFWLPHHRKAIEFNGVFHVLEPWRDFWRNVTRMQYGANEVIPVHDWDLPRIHQFLREKLGITSTTRRG